MRKFTKNKPAFTMIELVFVIIVIGILAALALPRMDRDLKQQAADSILSDIRYTQHLALSDYKHSDANASWQRSFWTIGFRCNNSSGFSEYVGSDADRGGGIGDSEAAIDPTNGKIMNGDTTCSNTIDTDTSDRIFLGNKFGVTSINSTGGCNTIQYIGFDHLGRPHVGYTGSTTPDYGSYMTSACTFTFTMSDNDTFAITIEPETGYASIVGQPSS